MSETRREQQNTEKQERGATSTRQRVFRGRLAEQQKRRMQRAPESGVATRQYTRWDKT